MHIYLTYLYPPQPLLTEHGGGFGATLGHTCLAIWPDQTTEAKGDIKYVDFLWNVNIDFNLYNIFYFANIFITFCCSDLICTILHLYLFQAGEGPCMFFVCVYFWVVSQNTALTCTWNWVKISLISWHINLTWFWHSADVKLQIYGHQHMKPIIHQESV